ncbi:MAG TPA: Ig-like domain-containing protein, partial [Ignavibacteriaceae bacterium]|nr:Ig-like domain-containing protein [Ignavibacteriaceae bacterium]
MKKYSMIKNLFLLLFSILFFNCANQLPPSGGEVDKIPPAIIEVYPADGTINYSDDYFEIGFSEYVDKRSVQDAIFISPAIEGEIEYDWSGKYLRVYFPNDLKEKTTYVITIGTDAADYNNKNRMAEAYTFTFSTGNEIDRRIITGKIYDTKAEDVMIFAYKLNDTISNPLTYKPDYISQAGNNGVFKLRGLAPGEYRIFAVQDEYRDLLFQREQDRIGIPYNDVILKPADTLYSGLNFFLTSADTASPRLLSAIMTDEYHILINLSEEFDSTIILKDNFHLIDSANGKTSEPLYAYKGNTKPSEFVLVVNEKFPGNERLFIKADTLRDREGNFYLHDFTSVTVSNSADTTKPKISKTNPTSGTKDADYQNQEFYFFFDDAFNRQTAETGISFEDTLGRSVKFNLTFLDDASFKIMAEQKLELQKDYIIKIDFSRFEDAAGN